MSEHPVIDAIYARRSIREYQQRPVEREKVEALLRAAMAAPSACNLQPWAFVVVDEPGLLKRLKAVAEQGQYDAPLAIVACGIDRHIPWEGDGWMLDLGAAIENMLLAAVELGLGSVWIGGFDAEALSSLLNIPADVHAASILYFGYPLRPKEPRTYYTEEAVHWQTYDPNKPRAMRTMQMLEDDIREGRA